MFRVAKIILLAFFALILFKESLSTLIGLAKILKGGGR